MQCAGLGRAAVILQRTEQRILRHSSGANLVAVGWRDGRAGIIANQIKAVLRSTCQTHQGHPKERC